ncbi:peptidase [Streptomyces sp. NBC_01210]|uniref:peptidase n=1 Tax=Streptomyces sp. NBC_01210 TaxID=2903774 RepID=UPI002E0EF5D0|nr:peptidase [Streptomyces sp. NBC_01210]
MAIPAKPALDSGPGRFGVRLVDVPVARRNDPRARIYVVDHLKPGMTIKRRIEVSNKSASPLRIDLYAASALVKDSRFLFGPARTPNELARWIRVEPGSVNLAARTKSMVDMALTVPRTAQSGERYAVVWAESQALPDARHNVGSIHRVGVRVYLDVGPGGDPLADFVIQKITGTRDKQGRPSVAAVVRNLGRRAMDVMSGQLTLKGGPGGVSAGPFRIPPGTTFAGYQTGTITIPLEPRLPDGPWKAQLELRSGPALRSATATLMLSMPKKPTSHKLWYPIGAAAALVLIALVTTVLLLLRRRRRNREAPDTPERRRGPSPETKEQATRR